MILFTAPRKQERLLHHVGLFNVACVLLALVAAWVDGKPAIIWLAMCAVVRRGLEMDRQTTKE